MRILHGPLNIAGMPYLLAKAQRDLGHDAVSVCLPQGRYGYQADHLLGQKRHHENGLSVTRFFLTQYATFDAYHFYFDMTFTGHGLRDLGLLKRLGKRIFFTFLGCDVRDSKLNLTKRRWSACTDCWPMNCSPNRQALLKAAHDFADAVFVTTPDLAEAVPGARLLLLPFDEDAVPADQSRIISDGPLRILHAPTDRQKKGTRYLEEAIAKLQAAGKRIDLDLVENVPQNELFRRAENADVVVDQILAGSYGTFGAEMMARGKPVIASVWRSSHLLYPEECPVIDANPDTILDVLEKAADGAFDLKAIGNASHLYAHKYHSKHAVASELDRVYTELGIT